MKTFLAAMAVAGTMVLSSALPSMAASAPTQAYGNLSDGDVKILTHQQIQGSFSDLYTFTLVDYSSFDVNLSVTAANSPGVKINGFNISISGPTAVAPQTISAASTGSTLSYADITLAPGSYQVIISGDSTGTSTTKVVNGKTVAVNTYASYSGPLTVTGLSAVPLPNSVAMFGTALLGLGAVSVLRRKRAVETSAV